MLLGRKKAALRRLFKSARRITSWRQQLVQRQERQLVQRREQQRQQLVQVLELVQQRVLVQVLEGLLSYRKLPVRKLQR